MPNASVLEKKQQQVAELAEKISGAVTGVVVDYKVLPLPTIRRSVKSSAKTELNTSLLKTPF